MSESIANPEQSDRPAGAARLAAASRTTGRWFLGTVATLLILLAVCLLIIRLGLPWLASFKGDIETRLTEQMGSPVSIEDLRFRWQQYSPTLTARGVALGELSSEQILLDEVLINVDVLKSVSTKTVAFDELTLVGVNVTVGANENGRFELKGLSTSEPDDDSSESSANTSGIRTTSQGNADALAWIMNTSRVGLQDSTITLQGVGEQEDYTVTDLNIVATNDNNLHQLRIDMQLPAELGGAIEMGVDLTGRSDDIRNAVSNFHLKASDLKVDAWRSLQAKRAGGLRLSRTGIARLDGTVQLELWGSTEQGSLQTARGQLSVADVVDLNGQERILDKVSTDIIFTNTSGGWQITSDALELTKGDEITIIDDVSYDFEPIDGTAWKLDANGEKLDLDVATKLVLSLFDDTASLPRARWLSEVAPKGDLYDWNASLALVDGKPDFSWFTIFHELEMSATDSSPGISKIGGTVDMKNNVGNVIMQGIDMTVELPAVFSKPLALEKLYGEFELDLRDSSQTSLKGDVVVEDRGLGSNTSFEVKLEPGKSPHVYAQGKFDIDDIADATRYIPVRLFKRATTNWFESALLAGKATNGELLMFGHIADYPFVENEGVFKIDLDYEQADVDYLVGWPIVRNTKGRLEMNGPAVRLVSTDGYIDEMRLSQMDLRIPNVREPVLQVSSTSAGTLPGLIDFANTGPLKATLQPAFQDMTGTGRAQMDLNITVPLSSALQANTVASAQAQAVNTGIIPGLKVNGSVFLRNNTLNIATAKVNLTDIDGAVGFTATGVRANNLQATMFGKTVRIDSKTEGRGDNRTIEMTMSGEIPAIDVLENYEIPLTQFVEGESRWNVSVRIPTTDSVLAERGITLAAVSNLVGTRVDLPAPLGKSARSATRMALSTSIDPESSDASWLIDYGDSVRSFVRVNEAGLQSLAGRLGGGAADTTVYDGIRLQGAVDSFSLDGWVESAAEFLDGLDESEPPVPILPISAEIDVNRFIVGSESVGGGRLRFNTDTDYINAKLESLWLDATARYPRVHWTQDLPAMIRVVTVDKRFIDAFDSIPDGPPSDELDPRTLPPLEVRVEQVKWDQLDLRGLSFNTTPTATGMNIHNFEFTRDFAILTGQGYWQLRNPEGVNPLFADQHVTRLNLTLRSDDFGELLDDVGFEGTLAEGEGVLSGSLQWSAPGYKPALLDLVGEMDVDMEKGRILQIEPGTAKLAGLFAFQTIPRRLNLDFKDIVLDGLDYETVRGSIQLANGIAHTSLMQLNGAVGVVDITGESDLENETFNQRLTVLPRVSAALPIIGIISGGATAGLGVLFAGGVLKAAGIDFDRLGLRDYTLTGSWDKPEIGLVPFEPFAQ